MIVAWQHPSYPFSIERTKGYEFIAMQASSPIGHNDLTWGGARNAVRRAMRADGLDPERDGPPATCGHGRFLVERDGDGWTLSDYFDGRCLSFDTKREALRAALFALAYVRRWGGIDFDSFPYGLDQEFAGKERLDVSRPAM